MKKNSLITFIIFILPSLFFLIGGNGSSLARFGGSGLFAQLNGINYQAVAVDDEGKGIPGMDINGQAIPSSSIAIRFSIIEASTSGTIIYQETHSTNTDMNGLFSLVIGAGTQTSSTVYTNLHQIPWNAANHFLKVEIDTKNDGNYKLVSVQQMMAVPYAFYATKSDTALYALNASESQPAGLGWSLMGNDTTNASTNYIGTNDSIDFVVKTNNSERLRIVASGNVGIGTATPIGKLHVNNDVSGNDSSFVVMNSGSVGIGTATPTAKLDVAGTLRVTDTLKAENKIKITDGTQGLGKILTSDANGLASWQQPNLTAIDTLIASDLIPLFITSVANPDSAPAINFTLSDASPNSLFGNNTSINATPTYFSPVLASPLFQNQGTATSVLHGNISGDPSWGQIVNADIANATIDLTTKVTGALPITNGGTNFNSIGNPGSIAYSDGTSYNFTSVGANGQVLQSSGTGTPVWSKRVVTINGTAPITAITTDTSSYSISVDTNSQTTGGVVLAGSGNFNKVWKTDAFGNPAWRNDSSTIYDAGTGLSFSGNTINSVWSDSLLNIYNNTTGNVGIGTAVPNEKLEVAGNIRASGISGTGVRMVQVDSNGTLVSLASGDSTQVLLGTGIWGAPPTTTSWALQGNEGTVDGINFIGTTDSVPFTIKVNNQRAGRISPATSGEVFLGYQAGNSNTSSGSVAIGYQALFSTSAANGNTAVGFKTLYSNSLGYENTAVGKEALMENTLGFGNVALGSTSLKANTSGYGNTALGVRTLAVNTTGSGNLAVGGEALFSNTLGNSNIALGPQALYSNTIGSGNIAIGDSTIFNNTSGIFNIAIGRKSLFSNTTGHKNLAVGDSSLYLNVSGNQNTAIGSQALYSNTTGTYNIGIGNGALRSNTGGSFNLALGFNSLNKNTASRNTGAGYATLYNTTSGDFNAAFGASALMLNTTGGGNTGLGANALLNNTTGLTNSAVGLQALYSNIDGDNNTAIGANSMYFSTTADFNTAVGSSSMYTNTVGAQNSVLGYNALYTNTTGDENVAVGIQALYDNISGDFNTSVGAYSLYNNTTGINNTASGRQSMHGNTTGGSNSAYGFRSLYSNTTGSFNTAIGDSALYLNTSGRNNTATGRLSLYSNSLGSNNTAYGTMAMYSNTTGISNSAFGFRSLYSNTIGSGNLAVGDSSLQSNLAGSFNTAVGVSTLRSNLVGLFNSAFGSGALASNTIGNYNTALGGAALGSNIAGDENVAVGNSALSYNLTGEFNVALGSDALKNNTFGTGNSGIGTNTLRDNTLGSYNTALGYGALKLGAAYSNSTALGYEAQVTASNMIQLGNTSITAVKTAGTFTASGYTTALSEKNSAYTLTALDDIVSVVGTTTITLPTAVGITGRKYTIKNVDAQTVTVDANGTETIDGSATVSLTTQYQYVTVVSDGSNWLIIANN